MFETRPSEAHVLSTCVSDSNNTLLTHGERKPLLQVMDLLINRIQKNLKEIETKYDSYGSATNHNGTSIWVGRCEHTFQNKQMLFAEHRSKNKGKAI